MTHKELITQMLAYIENAQGCFACAFSEGLEQAIEETQDERLKDLLVRRLMHATPETSLNTLAREYLAASEPVDKVAAMQRIVDSNTGYVRTHPAPKAEPVLQDIEQYRMQMAGICTAALGYWKEGDSIHPDYDTPALRDVANLYAKYNEHYKAKAEPVNQMLLDALEESNSLIAAMMHEERPLPEIVDQMVNNRAAIKAAEQVPQSKATRNILQAEVERIHAELVASEAVNKAAALEIVSLRAELEAANAERRDDALLNIARKAEGKK